MGKREGRGKVGLFDGSNISRANISRANISRAAHRRDVTEVRRWTGLERGVTSGATEKEGPKKYKIQHKLALASRRVRIAKGESSLKCPWSIEARSRPLELYMPHFYYLDISFFCFFSLLLIYRAEICTRTSTIGASSHLLLYMLFCPYYSTSLR